MEATPEQIEEVKRSLLGGTLDTRVLFDASNAAERKAARDAENAELLAAAIKRAQERKS
jgi:hypothetical protein